MKRLLLLLTFLLALTACSDAETEEKLGSAKEQLEQINNELASKESELEQTKKNLSDANDELEKTLNELDAAKSDLSKTQKEHEDVLNLAKDKEQLEKNVNDLKAQVNDLNNKIAEKQSELEAITAGVKARKEEPIELGAGEYLVGLDLPADRYEVFPIGRGSNFFVYGSSGAIKVNIILSNREGHGVPSYVFVASEGDFIETKTPVKFVPVE